MARLFEINEEIESILVDVVDEDTGEIIGSEIDLEKLNALDMERERILTYLCQLARNLEADAEAYRKLKGEFDKKMKVANSKHDRLKAYIQTALNGEKWEADDKSVKVAYRTTKDKVCVDCLIDIPKEFFKTPITESNLNKTELKKAILDGNTIAGAHLEDSVSMSIK